MDAAAAEIVARLMSGMLGAVCLWEAVMAVRRGETGAMGLRPVARDELPRRFWLHVIGFAAIGLMAFAAAIF